MDLKTTYNGNQQEFLSSDMNGDYKFIVNGYLTNKYQITLQLISDTLANWEKNNIAGYRSGSCNYSSYTSDSLLCFNKEKNRLVNCILERGCKEDVSDGIHFFYHS